MRIVVQRVSEAAVTVADEIVGRCGPGLLVLVGATEDDDATSAERLAAKVAKLRVFPNHEGRFDLSLVDVGGDALVVSQFTLVADTARGNRPSFTRAAAPEIAETLVASFAEALRSHGVHVEEGSFGARMAVQLVNDGPVTIVLET